MWGSDTTSIYIYTIVSKLYDNISFAENMKKDIDIGEGEFFSPNSIQIISKCYSNYFLIQTLPVIEENDINENHFFWLDPFHKHIRMEVTSHFDLEVHCAPWQSCSHHILYRIEPLVNSFLWCVNFTICLPYIL